MPTQSTPDVRGHGAAVPGSPDGDSALGGERGASAAGPLAGEPVVREASGGELVTGCALLAGALGFGEREALPPWLVQTAVDCGGLALGAFAGRALVGFSFALPALDGTLFSCGLAVAPAWRGRGLGRRVKLAQRDRARALGCPSIRWTAEPLNAPALALYLSGLGARLVAYAPELYAAVRPGAADDVVIEWPLAGAPVTGFVGRRVEIPATRPARPEWRRRVRAEMMAALAAGAVGTRVERDQAGRVWVVFTEPA